MSVVWGNVLPLSIFRKKGLSQRIETALFYTLIFLTLFLNRNNRLIHIMLIFKNSIKVDIFDF